MSFIVVTFPVDHFDTSPLKAAAPLNICRMVVTAPVDHFDTSPLKAAALLNMLSIVVTAPVFHFDTSSLKVGLFTNKFDMSDTRLTSQTAMSSDTPGSPSSRDPETKQ